MNRYSATVGVTDYPTFRYHHVYEMADDRGKYIVRVHEQSAGLARETWYGGKTLNLGCPAHSAEEAHRLAKVFWMDHLGWEFGKSKLAVDNQKVSR